MEYGAAITKSAKTTRAAHWPGSDWFLRDLSTSQRSSRRPAALTADRLQRRVADLSDRLDQWPGL